VERADEVLALREVDPVLPPIDESIWATSVVGTWMTRIPRRYTAARNPAVSPSAPPPTRR
jgi:hypothetical protein